MEQAVAYCFVIVPSCKQRNSQPVAPFHWNHAQAVLDDHYDAVSQTTHSVTMRSLYVGGVTLMNGYACIIIIIIFFYERNLFSDFISPILKVILCQLKTKEHSVIHSTTWPELHCLLC